MTTLKTLDLNNGNLLTYLYGGIASVLFEDINRGSYLGCNINPWDLLLYGNVAVTLEWLQQNAKENIIYAISPPFPRAIVRYPVPNYIILGQSNYTSENDLNFINNNPFKSNIYPISGIGTINSVEFEYIVTAIEGWAFTETYIEFNLVIVDTNGDIYENRYTDTNSLQGFSILDELPPTTATISLTTPITDPEYMYFYMRFSSPSGWVIAQIVYNVGVTIRLIS